MTLFNKFHTSTAENFIEMIEQLHFLYEYKQDKSLYVNRHEFKKFFLILLALDVQLLKDPTVLKLHAKYFKATI